MLIIFCYIIMTYGLSNILVHGYGPFDIIDKFRELINKISRPVGKMFECMMCTSTNIGIFLSILDILFINNINFTPFNILFKVELCHLKRVFKAILQASTHAL